MSAIEALEVEGKELPTSIFSEDFLVKRGWCTVAKGRKGHNQPHEIYYGALRFFSTSDKRIPADFSVILR